MLTSPLPRSKAAAIWTSRSASRRNGQSCGSPHPKEASRNVSTVRRPPQKSKESSKTCPGRKLACSHSYALDTFRSTRIASAREPPHPLTAPTAMSQKRWAHFLLVCERYSDERQASVVGRGRPISNSDTFYQPHLGIPLPPSRTCSALSVFLMSPTTKAVLPRRSVAPVGWTPIYLCLTWACEGGWGKQFADFSSDLR